MNEEKNEKSFSEENGEETVLDEVKAASPADGASEEGEGFSFTAFLYDWVSAFIVALIGVVILLTFVFRQVTVSGHSMNDTLVDKDRLIISNFMYTPKQGDIVIISHGESYNEPIVKRVIATSGQHLTINYDTFEVAVDGVVLDEPYIKGKTTPPHSNQLEIPEVIPEGYVFVMGDNRQASLDSRSKTIGLIPVENIIGKAEFRIFPLTSFGSIY